MMAARMAIFCAAVGTASLFSAFHWRIELKNRSWPKAWALGTIVSCNLVSPGYACFLNKLCADSVEAR